MNFSGTFYQSKVARRVLALFVLSALVPVAFLAVFSYRQVTSLLTTQAQRELTVFSAAYGTAAYDRLLLAERTLGSVAAELARGGGTERVRALGEPALLSLVWVLASGERRIVFGEDFVAADLGASELADLHAGKVLLLKAPPTARGGRGVGMARLVDASRPDGGWLAAEIAPGYLWGTADELPYLTSVCVQDTHKIYLYCSTPGLQRALEHKAHGEIARGVKSLQLEDGTHIAATREVFVASHFGKQFWVVTASRPEAAVFAPVAAFQVIFWGAVILAALVVLLLSVSQIRRTLIPLEGLTAAARRVAKRDFSSPVKVVRADEFGELAGTFNYMSTRLMRQFGVLETLSRIDRAILSDLNVASVIDTVLSRLPEIVNADFVAIYMLKQNADRDGDLHVKLAADAPVKSSPAMLSDAARAMLLQHPQGQWQRGAVATWLKQSFTLTDCEAREFFVLPVMWRNQLCGGLLLGWNSSGVAALEDEDIAHARDFADRVGVVLYSSAREAKLYYQARYDVLTGLPNRYLFAERLTQAMAQVQRERQSLAVLFIALDRFKNVSDAMGHAAGDVLIREAARRLRAHVRQSDTVCRFGGQEFVLLLSGELGPSQADVVAQNVILTLSAPFVIDGVESFIAASVGIAIYPNDGANAADLLRNADTACARASGHSEYVYFTESMNQRAVERASLERDLRRAIDEQQFLLFYQPKIDFASMRIVGAEALIRWRHPQRGLVDPGSFIELAEDTGLIVELGRIALAQACSQFAAWRDEGVRLEHIAVNVSTRQFRSAALLHDVRTLVATHRLAHGELELEVTESVMVDSVDEVMRALDTLRQQGARIALDDFGTGYSSMRYLETLPFDTLKIDMSFVRPIKANGEGGAIAEAIIALGRSLNKVVVAEGVETAEQAAFLKQRGCEIAQGYLYGKPLPAPEFAALWHGWTPVK